METIRKIEASRERMFLIAMATRRKFLAGINGKMDTGLFDAKYARLVAEWCLGFYKTYDRAPRRGELEGLYHTWDATNPPANESEAVRDFLEILSDQYEKTKHRPNITYLFKTFSKFMTLQKASRLRDQLTSSLLRGDDTEALNAITSFRSVDLGESSGFDALNDMAAWKRAFASSPLPIIRFPRGDPSYFFDDALIRGGCIGIQGVDKVGKSNWVVEFAFRALRAGLKVAMFQAGDLSETDIMRRLQVRISLLPLRKKDCRRLLLANKIDVFKNGDGDFDANMSGWNITPRTSLEFAPAWRARRRFLRSFGLPFNEPRLMLDVKPNSTLTVAQSESTLDRWENEYGFVPDVTLYDYADILAPENPRADEVRQVTDTWRAFRRLSQRRDTLVISPTQSKATAYDVRTQRAKHFSGSKAKNAEVTAMLTLNQTAEEKTKGIMRLGWSVKREGDFDPDKQLWVAQCIPLCRAFCCGSFYHGEDDGKKGGDE